MNPMPPLRAHIDGRLAGTQRQSEQHGEHCKRLSVHEPGKVRTLRLGILQAHAIIGLPPSPNCYQRLAAE